LCAFGEAGSGNRSVRRFYARRDHGDPRRSNRLPGICARRCDMPGPAALVQSYLPDGRRDRCCPLTVYPGGEDCRGTNLCRRWGNAWAYARRATSGQRVALVWLTGRRHGSRLRCARGSISKPWLAPSGGGLRSTSLGRGAARSVPRNGKTPRRFRVTPAELLRVTIDEPKEVSFAIVR